MLNKEYIKLQLELMNKTCFEFKNKLIVRMFENNKIKFITIEFDDNDIFVGYKVDYVESIECLKLQIKLKKQDIESNNNKIYNANKLKEDALKNASAMYLHPDLYNEYCDSNTELYNELIIKLNKENEQLEQEIKQLEEILEQSNEVMNKIFTIS